MLDDAALDVIFRKARTHNAWRDRPVTDDDLRRIYEVMKWGPTSANMSPARFIFVRSPEAKAKLAPALSSGNLDKTMAAPATAAIGYDVRFFERMDYLFPHDDFMANLYRDDPEAAEEAGFRNGTLQGAYFLIAARSLGFDIGAMSGFDKGIQGSISTTPRLFRRHPRFDFDDACQSPPPSSPGRALKPISSAISATATNRCCSRAIRGSISTTPASSRNRRFQIVRSHGSQEQDRGVRPACDVPVRDRSGRMVPPGARNPVILRTAGGLPG